MDLICQKDVVSELKCCADKDRHCILICGATCCGKTYLSKQYSKMINTDSFYVVEPKMDAVRDLMDSCTNSNTTITVCIENIDTAIPSVSNAILKFLEEPSSNVYIVITCKNLSNVLHTIISRCIVFELRPPTTDDLLLYANSAYHDSTIDKSLWSCIQDFSDIDTAAKLTTSQISYMTDILSLIYSNDPVLTKLWKLQKFPDGTPIPVMFLLKYIIQATSSLKIKKFGYEYIQSIQNGKIAAHAVLAKFLMDCMYS